MHNTGTTIASDDRCICEFSTVMTDDDIIWIVHGETTDSLVCRPKYIPSEQGSVQIQGKSYIRLHSPVFKHTQELLSSRNDGTAHQFLRRYAPVCETIYPQLRCVPPSRIRRILKSENCCLELPIGKSAAQLVALLRESGIFADYIGSLVLGSAVEGVSDINLWISEEQIERVVQIAPHIPGVSQRSLAQCRLFFEEYRVNTRNPLCTFYEYFNNMFQQFLYCGYKVSVFYGHSDLPHFIKNDSDAPMKTEPIRISGSITKVQKRFLPAVFELSNIDGKSFSVEVWDRAIFGAVKEGAQVSVEGIASADKVLIIPGQGRMLREQRRRGVFVGGRSFSPEAFGERSSWLNASDRVLVILYGYDPRVLKEKYEIHTTEKRLTMEVQEICASFKKFGISSKNIDIARWGEPVGALDRYDAVYLYGGDIDTLMARLIDSGLICGLDSFRGILMGYSAGAAVLSNQYYQHFESGKELIGRGLGYFPNVNVHIHYQKDTHAVLPSSKSSESILCIGDDDLAFIEGDTIVNTARVRG